MRFAERQKEKKNAERPAYHVYRQEEKNRREAR